MDEAMVRLFLELPFREQTRRAHRCPPSLEDPRLSELQGDLLESVVLETLDGLGLTAEAHERGLALAASALRRAAGEDRHDDPIVASATSAISRGDGW